MGFPYFELLIVNAKGDNECPCCGELDAGPHVYVWSLHNTEKSEWLKKLESIGGGRHSFLLTSEERELRDRMLLDATEDQMYEVHIWDGSSEEISDGVISLMFGPEYSDDFDEGFTVMLVGAVYTQDYWGEWDGDIDVIKEACIGGLDIEQEKLDNWKEILNQAERIKK